MTTRVCRQELSPVQFLERAGGAYADHVAVRDGEVFYTWKAFRARSRRLASALTKAGMVPDERVAFVALNSEPLLLAHHAVPLAGGVIVPVNTRLSAEEVRYVIEKSGATRLFYSTELESVCSRLPQNLWRCDTGEAFESFLGLGNEKPPRPVNGSEDRVVSINFTSGTTGPPKGVMCTHRAAFLNALAMALDHRLDIESRYLWTLPMFHCNGWMFPWALAAVGAQSISIPAIETGRIWDLIDSGITHFCAAPTVLSMLVNDPKAHRVAEAVRVFTAGSAPTPALLGEMESLGFAVDHVYGLTETSGPCTLSTTPPDYAKRSPNDRAILRARQGLPNVCAGEVRVVDPEMHDVPPDGQAIGEVVMRGNLVMKGYFNDPASTAEAFEGGWFHSGDLAVRFPDDSFAIVDRKKDIIISGGENVSSIEVERSIASFPGVLECAVVRSPDETWGEIVKAFVTLKPGEQTTSEQIVAHCRSSGLARYKVPRAVEFGPLPKTPTGKIRKDLLREREWRGRDRDV